MTPEQQAAMRQALEALEDLYDEQNAAPLWKRQEHWKAAMEKAEAAMPALRQAIEQQPAAWVGLTDEEWQDLSDRYGMILFGRFKNEIEAKLEEKNT